MTTPQARCSSSGDSSYRDALHLKIKNPNYDGLDFRGVEVVLTCILFFRTPCLCSTVCRLVSNVMICGINVCWNKSQNYLVHIFCIQSFKANSNDAMQCSNRMQEQTANMHILNRWKWLCPTRCKQWRSELIDRGKVGNGVHCYHIYWAFIHV